MSCRLRRLLLEHDAQRTADEYVFTADYQAYIFWVWGRHSASSKSAGETPSPVPRPGQQHRRLARKVCFFLWCKQRIINHGMGGAWSG